jgi:hypothetical protein
MNLKVKFLTVAILVLVTLVWVSTVALAAGMGWSG